MATVPLSADILQHPAIWRIGQMPSSLRASIKTGFSSLDQALPAHGWEQGALTEILADEQGIGELTLLVPAMRQAAQQGLGIVLVAPPYIPFPHAWEAHGIALKQVLMVRAEGQDALWAAEQAARSGACGMVVAWTGTLRGGLNYQALRRLQMAADAGGTTLVLYRPASAANEASAAPTRIALSASLGELRVRIVKRRAALMAAALQLNVFPLHWARRTLQRLSALSSSGASGSAAPAPHEPKAAELSMPLTLSRGWPQPRQAG
jgi:hypothetical protein